VVVALLAGGVAVAVAVQPKSEPAMTADQIIGAEVAITTTHPTPTERADLALARAKGLTDAQIRSAAAYYQPTGG
jgi:hypothetical protein